MSQTQSSQVIAMDEWRAHGIIMPACLLGMMLVAIHPYTLGVMLAPLEQEFGWTRSQISAGPLVTSLVTLLLSPFGGRAVDRFGPRKIALIGVPFFSLCICLISTATQQYWTWLALYALLALALIMIYPTVWTAAIARRFDRNRGLALAIALSGTGLTSAFVPYFASTMLADYGWRGAYIALGVLSFLIVYPIVIFTFARSPVAKPAMAAGRGSKSVSGDEPVVEASAAEAMPPSEIRSPKYVRLAAAVLVYTIAVTLLGINAVPILIEGGFDALAAAKIAGLLGIGTICGRIMGGFLLDRMDGRYVAILSGCGAILAVVILLAFEQSTLAASIACLSLGLAAGAEYDACAYLTTKHFHPRNFGALFGLIGGLSGFGSGVSPILANLVYDITGSYEPVLWALIPVLLLASVLFWSLGKYPEDYK